MRSDAGERAIIRFCTRLRHARPWTRAKCCSERPDFFLRSAAPIELISCRVAVSPDDGLALYENRRCEINQREAFQHGNIYSARRVLAFHRCGA